MDKNTTGAPKTAEEAESKGWRIFIVVIIVVIIILLIIAALGGPDKKRQKQGKQGKQGDQGIQGIGIKGPDGPKGSTGNVGSSGQKGPNGGGWIAVRDIYVDASTDTPQNADTPGTINQPFATISQALAFINARPAQNANDWVLGYTVYIAGNTYNEDLLVDVTFNRITLSAMGDVIITSPTSSFYNISVQLNEGGSIFGTSLKPTLTIESITSIDISRTLEVTELFVGSPSAFRLTSGLQASVDNAKTNLFLNLVINAKIAGNILSNYTVGGTSIGYQFLNSVVEGSFLGNTSSNIVLIQNAINSTFLSTVTADIGMASNCVFENGVVLFNSFLGGFNAAPQHAHKVGFRFCQINRSGPAFPLPPFAIMVDNSASGGSFVVDTFTNAWVTGYAPLSLMTNFSASNNSPTTAYNFNPNANNLVVLGATPVLVEYNTGSTPLNNGTNNYMLYGSAPSTVETTTTRVITGACVIRNLNVQINTTNMVANAFWTAFVNVNGVVGVLTSTAITNSGVNYSTAFPATDSYFVLAGPGSGISVNIVGTNNPTATTARASFDVVPLY